MGVVGALVLAGAVLGAAIYTAEADKSMQRKDLASQAEQNKESNKNSSWSTGEWDNNNNVAMQQYEVSIQTRKIEEGQSYSDGQVDSQVADETPATGGIYGPNRLS